MLAVAVALLSIYANLSFAVTDPEQFRYFPPFEPRHNANMCRNMGAEYFNIASALAAGDGFANPFGEKTGPTAWMPPVLPCLLAGLLWLCCERDCVMTVVLVVQTCVFIATGILVLEMARRTCRRLGPWTVAALYLLALMSQFHLCLQMTNDIWIVMLALDLLCAGLCWFEPLRTRRRAAAWGLFGGLCSLISPIAGFSWAASSFVLGVRSAAWSRFAVIVACAGLAMSPWLIRNYVVLGRFIPVKSNLVYELYQSQCLQPDGLLQRRTFQLHPYAGSSRARREYRELGEVAFVEQKGKLFWKAIAEDPGDFVERVACRFLGILVWYEGLDREREAKNPWLLLASRVAHPLPFLALLGLLLTSFAAPLERVQQVVVFVFIGYCVPYIVISYYERYTVPLLGLKVLLIAWALDRWRTWRAEAKRVAVASDVIAIDPAWSGR